MTTIMQGNVSIERDAFRQLAGEYNLIPIYKEILGDLHTPVSAFHKLDDGRFAYLLESVEGGETVGRYSFLGGAPSVVLKAKGRDVTIEREGQAETRRLANGEDPLSVLKSLLGEYRVAKVPGLPKFYGGAVGYFSYDTVRYFEELPDALPDDLNMPDCYFVFTDCCVIFDHLRHSILLVCNTHINGDPDAAYDRALAKIDHLIAQLQAPKERDLALMAEPTTRELPITSNVTHDEFLAAVEKAQGYIAAGDIIQVVLSQRLSCELSPALQQQPFNLYRALRYTNPSPYMYYLSYGDVKIIGSSPERLVSEEDGVVVTRPIAGTRKRGRNAADDAALAADLLADAKERAEHIMLVDLGRNDLGRVCDFGSVHVDELMVVENYSHVMHMVSNVRGNLRPELDHFDVLRACFPAGTVSGAPKIRAMQIIDEVETTRRGPYAGAIGYFSFEGNMDTAITIRTVVIKDGKA
ncbi:MAG TPA: anthranilate synthase component I, partial [Armatimonadota bacterium]|nr:anthranilate synthase component I [Armatimonadota bacterium]